MSPAYGIDAAWGASNINARALGASFIARYLSHDLGKALRRAEAEHWSAQGISIVCVFEDAARRCLEGYGAGLADGRFAAEQALACGMPLGVGAIYAACDDDFGPTDQPAIDNYLRGFRTGLAGRWETGGYGGYYPLGRAGHLVDKVWQTAAWSGGHWLDDAAIEQYSFGQLYDWNRAFGADYGQWRIGEHKAPADPLWFLLPDERHWAQVFDHFESVRAKQHGKLHAWGRSHEAHMARLMVERRKAIWTIAQKTGWERLHRDLRYRALRSRTERYTLLHQAGLA